jgi:hypothetical protein
VKKLSFFALNFIFVAYCAAQNGHDLIFPDSVNWNVLSEGKTLSLKVKAKDFETFQRFAIENPEQLPVQFDSTGNFRWTPSFDLVNRVEQKKDFTIFFEGYWSKGSRVRKAITFTVNHVNQPPVVEEVPVFYVKQSTRNNYQIPGEFISDPDGDPYVFKAVQSQLPEGATLSSQGQLTWTPSRSQFNALKNNPLTLEFIAQDQPDKAETKGKIKIAQTQLDLPPEILIVPGDSIFKIREDETLNLKIYVSDPNGDETVRNAGFVSSDLRITEGALKENTPLQYEFLWFPDYDFVDEAKKKVSTDVIFFVLDKSNNRVQRKIQIQVEDTENMVQRDGHQYQKYFNNLSSASQLIKDLDENQKKLNEEFKKAKKGKKKRSIVNASLGAVTGLSPVMIDPVDNPQASKVVPGVGGTAVLTLSTLEATEVIGRSRDDIMDKIKIGIDIRNKLQSAGDEFARKYSLKSARRTIEFEKDIDKLRGVISDQRIVLLEMDAYKKQVPKPDPKEVKKTFPDFSEGD